MRDPRLAAAAHPERLGRLVLSSCETPESTWPPGGFSLLKATAVHPLTYRALYQVLRWPRTWRWRNTYGHLAKDPIDAEVMRSYLTPVLTDAAIRHDGRKAIGSVGAHYTRAAAEHLAKSFGKPINLLWAADDRVFPLPAAQRYADLLNATLDTVSGSYTYTAEDQPEQTAKLLTTLLDS
jgi:pimeloyl-ACP methyl ester carboxylesterase